MQYQAVCFSLTFGLLPVTLISGAEKPVKPFFDDTEGSTNSCLGVSRDGRRLALNHWTIWDIPTGKKVLSGQTACSQTITFSPDGSLLVIAGSYSQFFVIDTVTGKVVWNLTLVGHGDTVVNHVAFTADGRFLVSGSMNGMLRVWDVRTKKAQALFCFPSKHDFNNSLREYLRAWKALAGDTPPDGVKTFRVFKTVIEELYRFSISPDGKTVAVAAGTSDVLIIELATGKILTSLHTDQVANLVVQFSGSGKLLAVGGGDDKEDTKKCTIEIWDVAATKRLITCPGHRHSVFHLAFSPDDKTIASGGIADGVRVWNVGTGKQRFALHPGPESRIQGLAFLPDGKTLLTFPSGENLPVHFWDAATGKSISPIREAAAPSLRPGAP
jgi:WD40 repeat protein